MAINSQENLSPEKYEWSDCVVPKVAVPGQTKFV
jgi:hypothetical protein